MSAPKSEKQKVEEFLKEFDPVEGPCENTDKLLWRNDSQPHAPSIHVTKTGSIGINVGGGQMNQNPIELNAIQESLVQVWAADDRLWTIQETVEFNLRVFARNILKAHYEPQGLFQP